MTNQLLNAQYLVLPRRYRPQTFASMVGQEACVITLKNALRHKKLAQAYLFSGPKGTGKTSVARLFAKALNCQNPTDEMEPCNRCTSCQEISSGRSLDVLEIDGASNRGIDDIREINETVGYAPASGKYKIYIIDEVHMLTKEAFNALLKTLEEPPAHVKFFFATTEPHKVLPTILSRCQRFDLRRIADDAMRKKLASIAEDLKIELEEAALSLIIKKAEGSLRDAESLLDQICCYSDQKISQEMVSSHLGLMPKETFFALDQAIHARDLPFAFLLGEQIFSSGKDLGAFLDDLMEHYRLILRLLLGQSVEGLSAKEEEQYRTSSRLYTHEQCVYILDYLMKEMAQFTRSSFKRITLEMLLLHLLRTRSRLPVELLVRRLVELEKSLGKMPEESAKREEPAKQEGVIQPKQQEEIKPVVAAPPAPPLLSPAASSIPSSPPPASAEEEKKKRMRQETLLRFASIELEGTLKK